MQTIADHCYLKLELLKINFFFGCMLDDLVTPVHVTHTLASGYPYMHAG